MSGDSKGQTRNERLKVLIVESPDKKLTELRKIISEVYDVITVSNETDALSLLKNPSNKISAGVFYITVAEPVLQGIHNQPQSHRLPVLIATDLENSDIEDRLLDLDAIDFLKTPFNKRRVLNRIKTAVKLADANRLINELERDELTTLLTRQAFLRKAEELRSENPEKTYCIIAFDFDNFKSSNSLYGESKCNEFLAYTGQHLNKAISRSIAGRFGGDQYVLFFEYEDEVHIERLYHVQKREHTGRRQNDLQ